MLIAFLCPPPGAGWHVCHRAHITRITCQSAWVPEQGLSSRVWIWVNPEALILCHQRHYFYDVLLHRAWRGGQMSEWVWRRGRTLSRYYASPPSCHTKSIFPSGRLFLCHMYIKPSPVVRHDAAEPRSQPLAERWRRSTSQPPPPRSGRMSAAISDHGTHHFDARSRSLL